MRSRVAIVATVIIGIGLLMTLVSVAIPYWEVNDKSITTNDFTTFHKGLWLICTTYSTGNWECDDYNMFFLALPSKLQAARGFGISAIVFGVLATLLVAITVFHSGSHSSRWMRASSGITSVLAGICILGAASWFGYDLYQEYRFQLMQANGNLSNVSGGRLMIFGPALYIGWVAGALHLLGGILAFCSACSNTDDDDYARRRAPYTYKAEGMTTVSKNVSEYV